jgi:hypothetical protein
MRSKSRGKETNHEKEKNNNNNNKENENSNKIQRTCDHLDTFAVDLSQELRHKDGGLVDAKVNL